MNLVDRFLDNACPDHHVRGLPDHARARHTALRLLAHDPGIAGASLATSIVCGDLAAVERALAERPELARLKSSAPAPGRSGGGGSGDLFSDLGPKGWEPLLYLCFTRLPLPAVDQNAVPIARLLLDHGADPTVYFMAGSSRYTPLVGAIGEGEEDRPAHPRRNELVDLLLEHGADPYDNQVIYNLGFHGKAQWFLERSYRRALALGRKSDWDDPEWSMLNMGGYGSGARWQLEHAIKHGDARLVEWCLAHGANPSSPPALDPRFPKLSLYEFAVHAEQREIAELLVRYGAERKEVTRTPLEEFVAACLRLDRPAVERDLAVHPEYLRAPEPLLTAARYDRADVVEYLLDLGMSPEVENAEKERPLHIAGYRNSLRVARLLIERGAEIDPREANWMNTPISAASYYQHREMIDLLTPHSRDVWELVYSGKLERLREVLRERPERARVAWENQTPLMWLPPEEEQRALEVVELLLEHGADPSLRDRAGMTAADRAERLAMFRVAARLREAEARRAVAQ